MSLRERAARIIAGRSTLEAELRTASSTEWCALCIIKGREDLLEDEDRRAAWMRLNEAQRDIVYHYNRSAATNLRSEA